MDPTRRHKWEGPGSHLRRANPGGEVGKILLRDSSVPRRGIVVTGAGPAIWLPTGSRVPMCAGVRHGIPGDPARGAVQGPRDRRCRSRIVLALVRRATSCKEGEQGERHRVSHEILCWWGLPHLAVCSTSCRVRGSHCEVCPPGIALCRYLRSSDGFRALLAEIALCRT